MPFSMIGKAVRQSKIISVYILVHFLNMSKETMLDFVLPLSVINLESFTKNPSMTFSNLLFIKKQTSYPYMDIMLFWTNHESDAGFPPAAFNYKLNKLKGKFRLKTSNLESSNPLSIWHRSLCCFKSFQQPLYYLSGLSMAYHISLHVSVIAVPWSKLRSYVCCWRVWSLSVLLDSIEIWVILLEEKTNTIWHQDFPPK
jgi:hypothetical protein